MTTAKSTPAMSTEEFRDRIRQLVGAPPQSTQERPCVRKPTDRGFYPPTRKEIKP